jgi:hypothetical protein
MLPVHRPQDHHIGARCAAPGPPRDHSMHLLCIPIPHVCACPTHAYRMTTRRPTHSRGFQLWSKTRRHNKVHPHAITHKGSWLAPEYAAFAKSGASATASTERRPGPPQAAPSATKLAQVKNKSNNSRTLVLDDRALRTQIPKSNPVPTQSMRRSSLPTSPQTPPLTPGPLFIPERRSAP